MKDEKFDAVQLMRQIRDQMGADLRDMSFDEQQAYIKKKAEKVRQELELQSKTTAA